MVMTSAVYSFLYSQIVPFLLRFFTGLNNSFDNVPFQKDEHQKQCITIYLGHVTT